MSNISWFSHTDNEIEVFYFKSWNICTYSVYFNSKKELNYNRFVDLNILGASRLVHSDLRIYQISFFLLDRIELRLFIQCKSPHYVVPANMRRWPTSIYCWPTIYDVGPRVKERWDNFSCLLGCLCRCAMSGKGHSTLYYRYFFIMYHISTLSNFKYYLSV